jgi:hypothetical protein
MPFNSEQFKMQVFCDVMSCQLVNIYVEKDRTAFNSRVRLSKEIKSSPTALSESHTSQRRAVCYPTTADIFGRQEK